MDKALHSIFYKLPSSSLPSIPTVTDMLHATVIFAWIRVKASQQVAPILDLVFPPIHFLSCSQCDLLKMRLAVTVLCMKPFYRFSFLKFLNKLYKALHHLAVFFTLLTR